MTEQLALHTQRWRERRESYRPAGETIRTREYDAAPIDESAAKRFVIEHHYSGSHPSARESFGLFRFGQLVGVAVLSWPMTDAVVTNVFPTLPREGLAELGRFVLLDEVPSNGETWFLGQAWRLLRERGYLGVVSFSDPFRRTTLDGHVVHAGHVGTIYQGHNAVYLGRSTPRTLRLLPDATVFSDRARSKVRAGERGWRYSAAILERYGAEAAPEEPEARRAWLAEWTPTLTRPVRHPGNHRYAWALERRHRGLIQATGSYPKHRDCAA